MSAEDKRILHIYSGDRVSGSNTDFQINVSRAGIRPRSVEFLSFESPASFQNVSSNYNTFIMTFYMQTVGQSLTNYNYYTEIPSSYFANRTINGNAAAPSFDVILTIPVGAYTGETLAATLKSTLKTYLQNSYWYYKQTAFNNIDITYNPDTYKITMTSNDGLLAWWVRKSYFVQDLNTTYANTLYPKLGFGDSQDGRVYMGLTGMISSGVADLSQTPVIYIYTRGLCLNSAIDAKGSSMDLLFKCQNNSAFGAWIMATNYSPGMARINSNGEILDHIYIQLRDQFGNILISDSEFYLSVVCYL